MQTPVATAQPSARRSTRRPRPTTNTPSDTMPIPAAVIQLTGSEKTSTATTAASAGAIPREIG